MVMALAVATTSTVLSTPARAVDPAAELLFQEGRQLLAEGHFVDACARFTQSFAVEASSGTLLNLALCNEKLGKEATALAQYRETARLAQSQGRADRAAAAIRKAEGLELTVARLAVKPTNPGEGFKATLDDTSIGDDQLGVASPIDPGPHKISATAPGRRAWQATIEIARGEQRALEIPSLELDAPPPPPPPPVPSLPPPTPAPAAVHVEDAALKDSGRSRGSRTDLYLVAGGGVLLVASAVIWPITFLKVRSDQNECPTDPGCPDYQSRRSADALLEITAWTTSGAAVALLSAAAVHHWWAKPDEASLTITPAAAGGLNVSLSRAF
jgi:hypothetical protein